MVNPRFIKFFNKRIKKELKKFKSGDPIISSVGSPEGYNQGLLKTLGAHLLRESMQYQAREYVHARIPTKNQYFSFMDITIPTVNVKKNSVQGVATFSTVIPYPVNETYILRPVGFSNELVPHKLVVESRTEPKKVIKEQMIKSGAINAINNDKKLLKKMKGKTICSISGLVSSYSCSIDISKYPPGMFTVVPFYNHSILIAKDAGISLESTINEPRYQLKDRFNALLGVSKYIAENPQAGEIKGRFYLDKSMLISIPPILENIEKQAK